MFQGCFNLLNVFLRLLHARDCYQVAIPVEAWLANAAGSIPWNFKSLQSCAQKNTISWLRLARQEQKLWVGLRGFRQWGEFRPPITVWREGENGRHFYGGTTTDCRKTSPGNVAKHSAYHAAVSGYCRREHVISASLQVQVPWKR